MADPEPHEAMLAEILGRLTDTVLQGGDVDITAECEKHPEIADELRKLWGAVVVADAAGASSRSPATLGAAEAHLADEFELPCQFGDYELIEEIGRGGMGVVYRARQQSLNRVVAVKMMLGGGRGRERERFQAEAESAARLDHPNVVPVHEVGQWQGRLYFSMKYLPGETLAQRMVRKPLSQREAAAIVCEVARAVHYAHRKGVLHRDLKPSNILIDEEGRPHVSDFGLAKTFQPGGSLTNTGAIMGTPAYMSPEQASGNRGPVGPTSDVYSLGAVLYHVLTGRPPVVADSPVNAVLQLLEQDVAPPRALAPDLDRDLELITLRCLQKPADLRYADAESLANDLQAYLDDEPITAQGGRLAEVWSRLFRETHHAQILENWGKLWMLHSLVLFCVCFLTNILALWGVKDFLSYGVLWTIALWGWAAVFWWMRRRMGPVLFVERQIAHIWAGSMACIAFLFPIELMMDEEVLYLAPVLALVSGMTFVIKAGILSGAFYVQAAALFVTAIIMALVPDYSHFIFGVVASLCFFVPGLKYYRQRKKRG